jgi:hypothetical protein
MPARNINDLLRRLERKAGLPEQALSEMAADRIIAQAQRGRARDEAANEAACLAAVGKEITVNSPSGRVIRGTVEKAKVYRGRCFRVTVNSYGQRFGPYEVAALPR